MSVMSALRGVSSVLRRYPLPRDMAMFGSLFVGAEFTQQTLLKKIWKVDENPKYDLAALARYAAFGVAFYPVIYFNWYRFLDRRWPGTANSAVTKKVLMDQFILEPPLICAFYIGMNIMEGREDIFIETKSKFLPTFAAGCIFWMPAMAVNFYFLPLSMRVGFVGVCTFVWDNFLCWLKRRKVELPEGAQVSANLQKSEQIMVKSGGQSIKPTGRTMISDEQVLDPEVRSTLLEEKSLLWKTEAMQSAQQCPGHLSLRRTNLQSIPDVR